MPPRKVTKRPKGKPARTYTVKKGETNRRVGMGADHRGAHR